MESISFNPRANDLGTPVAPTLAPAELARNRDVIQAVQAVNKSDLFGDGLEMTFALDRDTKRMVVKLKDSKTGETIRQIPPEYVLRLAEDLKSGRRRGLEEVG